MKQSVRDLLRRLDLRAIGDGLFEGEKEPNSWGRLFGGMVAAQALSAACRTVSTDRLAHSLHAYFLRPGDPESPVRYSVDPIRDGKSFTTRRVVAEQHGKAIFNMSASFHVEQHGYAHQMTMPDVPPPESLEDRMEFVMEMAERIKDPVQRARFIEERPIEMRYQHRPSYMGGEPSDGPTAVWFRAASPLPDGPLLHRCVLTYASDMSLLDNIRRPHGSNGPLGHLQVASLDHALWFHLADIDLNGWLLYYQDSPVAANARGFARGTIYSRSGVLVASVAQEGLMRPYKKVPQDLRD